MGVAVAGALLGVTVGLLHRVIDIDKHHPVRIRQQRCVPGQVHQHGRRDLVELPDMTIGERAKEGAQRRRRTDPAEQPSHPAMPQPIQIINRVRPGHHPSHHRSSLDRRIRIRHRQ
jgi:hypothetical protein